MQNLSLEEERQLQSELANNEAVLWRGKPNPRIVFHLSDWYIIPFSLLWGGFAIFWEGGVTGMFGLGHAKAAPSFFMLWGIPFIVIGQYFIWGRFFYAAWRKGRLLYAITDRRVLVISLPPMAKTISAFIENVPVIDKEIRSNGNGTIKFGQLSQPWGSGRSNNSSMDGLFLNSGVPVFVDIDDAASAFSIVADLRQRVLRQPRQEQ